MSLVSSLRAPLVLGAVAVLSIGCSDDQSSAERQVTVPGQASSVLESLDPSEPASPYELDDEALDALGAKERDPTPLDELLKAGEREVSTDAQLAREEALQICMKENGFDYAIRPPDTEIDTARYDDEYVVNATLGYGVTTFLGREPLVVGSVAVDPNDAIISALNESEFDAYIVVADKCTVETGYMPSPEQQVVLVRVYDQFAVLLEELEDRIQSDSEVIQAWQLWQTCLSRSGYNYPNRFAIFTELSIERDDILNRTGPDLLSGRILLDDLPPDLQQELAELQTKERAIAQVDLSCREGLDDVIYEARVKVEQAMIDEDPGRIEALRLALAELQ